MGPGSTTRAALAAAAVAALCALAPASSAIAAPALNAPAASGIGGTLLVLLTDLNVPVCSGVPFANPTPAEQLRASIGAHVGELLDALPGGGHACPG